MILPPNTNIMKLHLYNQQFEYMFCVFYGMKKSGVDCEEFNSIWADLDFEAKQYYGEKYNQVIANYDDLLTEFTNTVLLHSRAN